MHYNRLVLPNCFYILPVYDEDTHTNKKNNINYHKKIAQCSKFCYRKSLYNRMHIVSRIVSNIVSNIIFLIHLLIIDDFTYD